jgi:hypothetical protein
MVSNLLSLFPCCVFVSIVFSEVRVSYKEDLDREKACKCELRSGWASL